jgi:hypothetical protein
MDPYSEAGSNVSPLPTIIPESNPFPWPVTTIDIFVAGPEAGADVYFCFSIFLIAVHVGFSGASRSANSTPDSSPAIHCDPSINLIKRPTRVEIAGILLGI